MMQANWKNLTDPAESDFNNSVVNFYDGALIEQVSTNNVLSLPTGIREGKRFIVANSDNSRQSIRIEYQASPSDTRIQTVAKGEVAVFFALKNDIWDIVGGEGGETGESLPASAISETITSLGTASVSIGAVPANAMVVKVGVEVIAPFTGASSTTRIQTDSGISLMEETDVDILAEGYYEVERPLTKQAANGGIQAMFSPAESVTGEMKVVVTYSASA